MDKKRILKKYMEETSEDGGGGGGGRQSSTADAHDDPFFATSWSGAAATGKRRSENLSDSDDPASPVKKTFREDYKPASATTTILSRSLAQPSQASINDTINAFKAEAEAVEASSAAALSRDHDDVSKNSGFKRKGENEDFASKMMKKMGYEQGKGLGAKGQGIVKPIDESNQKGKQGLGFKKKNFDSKVDSWDYENDPASAVETPEWLLNESKLSPSLDELMSWKKHGDKKRILDDETHFCSAEIVRQVLKCKSIFDDLENKDMMSARSRANPYESIGAAFFQNRAALKMANIDAVFEFMFTNPVDQDGVSKVKPNEPLYFCDVCAGPGGFSEYVLWRRRWRAKGFGMTLKNDNDFRLDDFVAGSAEYFEPFYGEHGVNGDGDVTKEENLLAFQKFVLDQTNQEGVHFFMADGGFSVEGNENIQEILSKQLYLCQFLCALSVLRIGGNFVCKLFDIFTPFSVGLVYLMYLCFDRVCIHKPVTSRPANSERYIVCEGAGPLKDTVFKYMLAINKSLNETFRNENIKDDVVSIVPLSVLKEDEDFYNYIVNSNESFGKVQVLNLKKVQAFATNPNLHDLRQLQMIDECLSYWKIPTNIKRQEFIGDFTQFRRPKPGQPRFKQKVRFKPLEIGAVFGNLNNHLMNLKTDLATLEGQRIVPCDSNMFSETFKRCSIYDYRCMISSGPLVLLLSCGRSQVYECKMSNGTDPDDYYNESRWLPIDASRYGIELPMNTLVLAEKCVEYRGSENGQTQRNTFHFIDAFVLDGDNLLIDHNYRVVSMEDRRQSLEIFVKAVSKESRSELCPIRVKDLMKVENLEREVLQNLAPRIGKMKRPLRSIALPLPALNGSSASYVYPTAVYFFKQVEAPWSIVFSKNSQRFYYYNSMRNQSTYDIPTDTNIFASPKSYMHNGFIWIWNDRTNIYQDPEEETSEPDVHSSVMTKDKFLETIRRFK